MNVFKPAGPTSAQVGARVRRIYARMMGPKVPAGHLGTLDPMAAGVLPLALGKATRLIPFIEDRRKSYVCVMVLGRTTATGDATGETLEAMKVPADAAERVAAVLPRFVGVLDQIPPMYSAVRIGGRRLYEMARAGETVERLPRKVTIYGVNLLGAAERQVRLSVACSEGTYIRTLCEDIGKAAGVHAHMGALLREASGPFVVYDSVLLEDLERDPEAALISPERVIPIPTIVLDGRSSADFRAGRMVPLPSGAPGKHVFVRDSGRNLVGVGESIGVLLAPRKVFV